MKAQLSADNLQPLGPKPASIKAAGMSGLKALLKSMISLLKPVWTELNELALGIQTEPKHRRQRMDGTERPFWRGEATELARHNDNFHYVTIDYWNARKVARVLNPGPEAVFYDIGCGMGRILCVMARHTLRKCVGVELLEPLCQVARRNATKLRGRKTPIEIFCGDATTADLAEGTIYFMFNPFGAETLRDTLENIRCSLSENPRAIRVVYYNSIHQSVLEDVGWLEKVRQFDSFGGLRVTIWENRGLEDAQALRAAPSEKRCESPRAVR